MNTRSAREYTVFASAQLLRNWREQRPSSQGDVNSSVTGEAGRAYLLHRGGPSSDIIFVPENVIVVWLRFQWYTLYFLQSLTRATE
jgi:hypothetical protein